MQKHVANLTVASLILGAVLGFGYLYGSPGGVMGDLAHYHIDFKSKVILALSMFGFLSVLVSAVAALRPDFRVILNPLYTLLAAWVCVWMAFSVFMDCAVFTFCS